MSKESALSMLSPAPLPTSTFVETPQPVAPAPVVETALPEGVKSTAFNHLAKKEAEIVRQRQEIKKEQERNKAESDRLMGFKTKYDEYLKAKETDPVGALKMLGFSETDIFNYMANQQPKELTPEEKAHQIAKETADAQIKAFEENQAKREREVQQKQDQELIQGFKSDISKVMASDSARYEYCNYYGPEAENLAYELTLAVVTESKGTEVLSPQEAIQMAEEYFEERDQEMMNLKKRQPKVTQPIEPVSKDPVRTRTVTPAQPNETPPKPTITRTRTLSNAATSTVASTRLHQNETREQKKERLMAALRNGSL